MNSAPNLASSFSAIPLYVQPIESIDRPFNGFRITATEKAALVVSEAAHLLLSYEDYRVPRKRKRKADDSQTFTNQVQALICDLIHRELTCPGGWLAISLANTALGSHDRYKSKAISKTIKNVLDYMTAPEMGYAKRRKGLWVPSDRSHCMLSTIRAGERLRDRINEYRLTCEDFKLDKIQETIILKGAKEDHNDSGAWLQYTDTNQTNTYRADLGFINESLADADIDYLPCAKDGQMVDATDRRLRRYFNNGSFEQGGRLFGGFWQGMSKRERQGIVIEGDSTVTLDFGQMNPRILYGLAGKDYDGEDAYTIPRLEEYRDGVKVVFNSMLHRTKPMKKKPRGTAELFPMHVSIREITAGIAIRHTPIADLFYQGIGMRLLYDESQILVEVLTRLIKQGIIALPVHDAVIVARHHQEQATEVMLEVFKDSTGIDGVVKLEEVPS